MASLLSNTVVPVTIAEPSGESSTDAGWPVSACPSSGARCSALLSPHRTALPMSSFHGAPKVQIGGRSAEGAMPGTIVRSLLAQGHSHITGRLRIALAAAVRDGKPLAAYTIDAAQKKTAQAAMPGTIGCLKRHDDRRNGVST